MRLSDGRLVLFTLYDSIADDDDSLQLTMLSMHLGAGPLVRAGR